MLVSVATDVSYFSTWREYIPQLLLNPSEPVCKRTKPPISVFKWSHPAIGFVPLGSSDLVATFSFKG